MGRTSTAWKGGWKLAEITLKIHARGKMRRKKSLSKQSLTGKGLWGPHLSKTYFRWRYSKVSLDHRKTAWGHLAKEIGTAQRSLHQRTDERDSHSISCSTVRTKMPVIEDLRKCAARKLETKKKREKAISKALSDAYKSKTIKRTIHDLKTHSNGNTDVNQRLQSWQGRANRKWN